MRRRAAAWVLGVYCALLALLVFSPVAPSLHGVELPEGLAAGAVETAANVLVFVPVGFLVAGLMSRGREWVAVVACFLASAGIEILQTLTMLTRHGSSRDVLTNTAGAIVGAAGCYLVRRLSRAPYQTPLVAEGDSMSQSPNSP